MLNIRLPRPTLPDSRTIGLTVAFLLALFMSSAVFAQAGLVNLDALKEASRVESDIASDIMTKLFGPIFTDPWATVASGSTTLFGVIFLAFNVVVFSAGVSWATYGVLSGVVQSAHEGEVLGKRMSAIWMPIRMVTGIGSLVPAFGGFSLSQVIMIVAAGWGITFGNYAYKAALEKANEFTPLVDLSVGNTARAQNNESLANAIFKQELCRMDYERMRVSLLPLQPATEDALSIGNFQTISGSAQSVGAVYGTPKDPTSCSAVGIKKKIGAGSRSGSSSLGFRVGSIDYASISSSAFQRYSSNYGAFDSSVRTLANTWGNTVIASDTAGTAVVSVPHDQIRALAQSFTGQVNAATASNVDSGLFKRDAYENMLKFGFFGAGAFYSTLAEANTSLAQASDVVELVIKDKNNAGLIQDNTSSAESSRLQNAFLTSSPNNKSNGTSSSAACGMLGFTDATSTGDCSWGQSFIGVLLGQMTNGSGDGGSGSATGRIIDPIIAAKNLGDYMMVTGETILGAAAFAGSFNEDNPTSLSSATGSVLSNVVGWAIPSWIKNLGKALLSMLPIIGGLLLAVGALLALYIPMVPFISWVSALVQYVSIVVEALAAAPLWSFAHLQPDGEGMGQRSERGYLYLLLLLFKPILMVAGFFSACGLVVLLGSAVLWLFIPAMNNVQGNSVTGIFSVIGYVFMFFMLMNIIIQGLFNMVMDLSDDVIGWVGNVGKSQAGRDTEGKAHGLFVAGGRFGTTLAERGHAGAAAAAAGQGASRGAAAAALSKGAGKGAGIK